MQEPGANMVECSIHIFAGPTAVPVGFAAEMLADVHYRVAALGIQQRRVAPTVDVTLLNSRLRVEVELLSAMTPAAQREGSESTEAHVTFNSECPVCMGDICEPTGGTCGHAMCKECLIQLASRARRLDMRCMQCPLCRADIVPRALPTPA